MKILHLINDTYQVVNEDESTVLFQGDQEDCGEYIFDKVFQSRK